MKNKSEEKKKTYCAKCLRTSDVVDMSNCPFCNPNPIEKIIDIISIIPGHDLDFLRQSLKKYGEEMYKDGEIKGQFYMQAYADKAREQIKQEILEEMDYLDYYDFRKLERVLKNL
jgi:hypothetical protein